MPFSGTGGEARLLTSALEAEDELARVILDEVARDLACGLAHVTHLMHPERIVLGGGLAFVGEPLRAAVAANLTPLLMEAFQPGPEICLTALGEDSVTVGCLVAASGALRQ